MLTDIQNTEKAEVMHILEIEYTAELVKSVALIANRTVSATAQQIGASGIARLVHNAPMNRLLPYEKIVSEILHDHDFFVTIDRCQNHMAPDRGYGHYISALVAIKAKSHSEYSDVLYELLTGTT